MLRIGNRKSHSHTWDLILDLVDENNSGMTFLLVYADFPVFGTTRMFFFSRVADLIVRCARADGECASVVREYDY